MPKQKKRIRYSELFDAIEKNGYEQAFGNYHEPFSSAFCAMGQASKNLGFSTARVVGDAMYQNGDEIAHDVVTTIVEWNDGRKWSLKYIAETAREKFSNLLDKEFEV